MIKFRRNVKTSTKGDSEQMQKFVSASVTSVRASMSEFSLFTHLSDVQSFCETVLGLARIPEPCRAVAWQRVPSGAFWQQRECKRF